MCPTELLHDPSRPPSIRLLPIETRLKEATVAEYKNYPDEWVTLPLDLASPERMADALSRVSQVKRVPVALARRYGLTEDANDIVKSITEGEDGAVDIPCWRHAVVNFPHPLLQQGLVILDTPGLNAIGTEPELTLSLLPQAHAVLFILAADAGVTRTDLDVWRRHLAGEDQAAKDSRLVILNKIDGLWDGLKQRRGRRARDRAAVRPHRDDAQRAVGASVPGLRAEGAAREGERGRRAARPQPPADARERAVGPPDPGEAPHRRHGHQGRGPRARRRRPRAARRRARRASPSSSPR